MYLTKHLYIERADLPKRHDMFKARDAKAWQRDFPVGFPVKVCISNLLLINIFLDIVAPIESRCVIKPKHDLLVSAHSFDFFYIDKRHLFLKCYVCISQLATVMWCSMSVVTIIEMREWNFISLLMGFLTGRW